MSSTDVKAAYRTTTGNLQNEAATGNIGRARLRGVFLTGTGTLEFREGSGSGLLRMTLNSTGTADVILPGNGILFETGIHVTFTGVTAATCFYTS